MLFCPACLKKFFLWVFRELEDYKLLLRNIPSPVVSIFILSIVCANLMANKELVNFKFIALDCGFAFSWIMFLCMDVICRRWGARASIKVSLLALAMNLCVCAMFAVLSKAPGKWGEYYASGNSIVNDALNSTFGGSWYVVLGSSAAFVLSSVVNALVNDALGAVVRSRGFFSFAFRSYISTGVAQFADNLVFALIVSKVFFGWTWTQVFICSAIAAVFELLCEVAFSGLGYRIVCNWEKENVGQEYINGHS
ncbi:VUT family protein [Treponema sp.]|uniref:VUT family protein n=1 Tax=Treponema sp. TaxID=166 RepID=UPI003EFD8773